METLNDYTIYCTSEQVKKALELGAQIKYKLERLIDSCFKPVIPSAEQMIGWLEGQEGISEIKVMRNNGWGFQLSSRKHYEEKFECGFHSRPEATLAAIDAALDYLIQNKK